jgi:hypothetical protein
MPVLPMPRCPSMDRRFFHLLAAHSIIRIDLRHERAFPTSRITRYRSSTTFCKASEQLRRRCQIVLRFRRSIHAHKRRPFLRKFHPVLTAK